MNPPRKKVSDLKKGDLLYIPHYLDSDTTGITESQLKLIRGKRIRVSRINSQKEMYLDVDSLEGLKPWYIIEEWLERCDVCESHECVTVKP